MKFADLLTTAKELGADALATGHYVRRVEGANGAELHAPPMPRATRATSCSRPRASNSTICVFRSAAWRSATCARIAEELGLAVAAKPDSQDICFVPDGDYAKVVARVKPDAARPGEIVDQSGNVLGRA